MLPFALSQEASAPSSDGLKLLQLVEHTPVVDGSGLKNTLEREVIRMLANDERIPLKGKKVLMVCALDRFGMAGALEEAGAKVTYGDLIFSLNLDQPILSLDELAERADKLLPDFCKLPISMLYPTGKKQADIEPTPLTDKCFMREGMQRRRNFSGRPDHWNKSFLRSLSRSRTLLCGLTGTEMCCILMRYAVRI